MEYVYINDDGMFLDHPAYDMEESKTLTVGELIDVLKQYPKETPCFSHLSWWFQRNQGFLHWFRGTLM